MPQIFQTIRVGWFLGFRQIMRANIWTTLLIIVVMTLTFLNLVVISGILVGLIEGGNRANRDQYSGDVLIRQLPDESDIIRTTAITDHLDASSLVTEYSPRYITSATIEANYQTRRDFNTDPNTLGTSLVGLDVNKEEETTGISRFMIEGEFLDPSESGYIIIGATLSERHSNFSDLFDPLREIYPGTRVKVSISPEANFNQDTLEVDPLTPTRATQEFIVKGLLETKVNEVSGRLFITESDFRRLTGRTNLNANEIAIVAKDGVSEDNLKSVLLTHDFDRYGEVKTATEAIPQFLDQIRTAFGLLGNVIGGIGIIVASITIFIVIYINAITRRKYIGILKAIGIHKGVIQWAYVMQAFFYAIIGSGLGILIVYALLVPAFEQNPLNFPFSDGILVATPRGTLIRLAILLVVTAFAGLIPATLVIRKNTLDSILGR